MNKPSIKKLIWEFLVLHPNVSAKDISNKLDIDVEYCRETLRYFVARKWVRHTKGKGTSNNPKLYSAKEEIEPVWGSDARTGFRVKKHFKKNSRQKLWNNMKIERNFTAHSIISAIDVPVAAANKYIRALRKVGYVKLIRNGKKTKGRANGSSRNKYCLVRDTGRLAPIVRKEGVWDQNEQRLLPFADSSLRKVKKTQEASHVVVR